MAVIECEATCGCQCDQPLCGCRDYLLLQVGTNP